MTLEHRRKAKDALWMYKHWKGLRDPVRQRWCRVIEETVTYYRTHDAIREKLIERRYLNHETRENVVAALNIGRTTYAKANEDILSTVAILAAQKGLL